MSISAESSRPLLLPQNRRLRHLQGVYLRNLSFVRPRGRTIDDFDVNKESPNKLDALKDSPQLHHAASTENLGKRPAKIRRRSTILAAQNPVTRQKQLELTVQSRAADIFFSLHVDAEGDPVYISEVRERSMVRKFSYRNNAGPD
jgi:UV radiation resistance-associated gene protein